MPRVIAISIWAIDDCGQFGHQAFALPMMKKKKQFTAIVISSLV